jgi:hypothetical protein
MTFLQRVASVAAPIGLIRVAILLVIGGFVALAVPDQVLELYVIYAQALSALAGTAQRSASDVPLAVQLILGLLATLFFGALAIAIGVMPAVAQGHSTSLIRCLLRVT